MTFQETLKANTKTLATIARFRATVKTASPAELIALADLLKDAPSLRKQILDLAVIRAHRDRRTPGYRLNR